MEIIFGNAALQKLYSEGAGREQPRSRCLCHRRRAASQGEAREALRLEEDQTRRHDEALAAGMNYEPSFAAREEYASNRGSFISFRDFVLLDVFSPVSIFDRIYKVLYLL